MSSKLQLVQEIHRDARANFERRKYSMRGIADTLQADLIEMQQFKRENRGYRYILIVIDTFSKRVYAESLKDKTAKETTKAMEIIFGKVGQRIRNVQTDDGKEFFNDIMKRLFTQYDNINHYSTYSRKKSSIVERVIRSIKKKLYMQFNLRGSHKWYDILQKVINTYNNT